MIFVVMGVSACGKTTIGMALARRLECRFIDGDEYHTASNKEKLRHNVPLDDADRLPWLELLAELLKREVGRGETAVLACSALKRQYREVLRSSGHEMTFVHIAGPRALMAERLRARAGHHDLIFDYDRILEGQYRDLEPPAEGITVDAHLSPEEAAEAVVKAVG